MLSLDTGNTICCHTSEIPKDTERSERHSGVMHTTTCCARGGLCSPKCSLQVWLLKLQEYSTSQATSASNATNHHPQLAFKTLPLNTALHTTYSYGNSFYFELAVTHLQKSISTKEGLLTTRFMLSIYSLS